jgi:hypothetical protein
MNEQVEKIERGIVGAFEDKFKACNALEPLP